MKATRADWLKTCLLVAALLLAVFCLPTANAQTYQNGDIVGGGSGVTFPKYNTVWLGPWNGLYAPAPGVYCYQNGPVGGLYPVDIICDDSGDGYIAYRFVMPRDYKLGTDIDVHVYWTVNTVAATAVVWSFGWRITAIENVTGALSTDPNTVTVGGQYLLKISKLHTFAGPTVISETISGELQRVGNDPADSYVGSAYVLGMLFVYETDSIASAGVMTK